MASHFSGPVAAIDFHCGYLHPPAEPIHALDRLTFLLECIGYLKVTTWTRHLEYPVLPIDCNTPRINANL
jgi:hypothetical protein